MARLSVTLDDAVLERLRHVAGSAGLPLGEMIERQLAEAAEGGATPPEKAGPEELQAISTYSGAVLTAPGGKVWASDRQRAVAAFLANGWLLVAEEERGAPEVAALRAALLRDGETVKRVLLVPARRVTDAYRRAPGTERQAAFAPEAFLLELLSEAATTGAGEIHLSVTSRGTAIRFRVGGAMTASRMRPREDGERAVATCFLFDQDRQGPPKDPTLPRRARIATLDGRPLPPGVEMAILSWVPSLGGGAGVLRVSRPRDEPPPLEEIGLTPAQVAAVRFGAARAAGLCAIAGPGGSGRTTTLASVLADPVAGGGLGNLVSVEDQPEHLIRGAVEVRVDRGADAEGRTGLARAIAAAREIAPDALAVGEVDGSEAALLALGAASSMVSVWATIRAASALAVPRRLLDLGASPDVVRDPARIPLLVGQRVLRAPCPSCRRPLREADPDAAAWLDRLSPDASASAFSSGACGGCGGARAERSLVAEVVVTDREVLVLAAEGRLAEAWEALHARGVPDMATRAADLAASGLVDGGEAWKALG